MQLIEGILITIIIILTVYIIINRRPKPAGGEQKVWDCVDRATGEVSSVSMQLNTNAADKAKAQTADSVAMRENAEFFTDCQSPMDTKQSIDCECNGATDGYSYAVNEFGAKDMTYNDWVATQSIEPQAIKNHIEFIKDRTKNKSQNITGRTYTADSHGSYDPIPWQGLRRPQAVKVCNPTQLADVDYSLYDQKPRFTWSSS